MRWPWMLSPRVSVEACPPGRCPIGKRLPQPGEESEAKGLALSPPQLKSPLPGSFPPVVQNLQLEPKWPQRPSWIPHQAKRMSESALCHPSTNLQLLTPYTGWIKTSSPKWIKVRSFLGNNQSPSTSYPGLNWTKKTPANLPKRR